MRIPKDADPTGYGSHCSGCGSQGSLDGGIFISRVSFAHKVNDVRIDRYRCGQRARRVPFDGCGGAGGAELVHIRWGGQGELERRGW